MKKKTQIIIQDSEDVKNIFIQVNLKDNKSSVLSCFSAWENLAFIMEALALTAEECIKEGISRKRVYRAIKEYLVKVLGNYY